MSRVLFILPLLVLASCNSPHQENSARINEIAASDTLNSKVEGREVIEPMSIDTVLIGDMNSDGIQDTAFILTPPVIKHLDSNGGLQFYSDCVNGDCYNKISFSCGLPNIFDKNSILF